MLAFKSEVRIRIVRQALVDVLAAGAEWSLIAGVGVEINSINDSAAVHKADSLHSFDLAVDLDTVGDKTADLESLAHYLRRVLHPQYDVIFETDHVHVEWDAHRGPLMRSFP